MKSYFRKKEKKALKLYVSNVWKYLFEWTRPICKTKITYKILCEVSLDDSVIIVKTKEEAKNALKEITKFLDENLGLKLNKKTQIFKGKQGVNFCGYKINEYRMKLNLWWKMMLICLVNIQVYVILTFY